MTFEEIFQSLKERFMKADVSKMQEHVAFQFDITGEGAGSFYAEVKDGKLAVEPFDYKDRDVLLRAKADTFLSIANGKLDPVVAFTLGKLKVEGDISKALIIKELVK